MRICASCMSRMLGTGSVCSPLLLRQEIALRQRAPTHSMLAFPWSATRIRHIPFWSSAPGMLLWAHENLHVENHGRKPTPELGVMEFLTRELVADISLPGSAALVGTSE